jgi:hypothetical protein
MECTRLPERVPVVVIARKGNAYGVFEEDSP